ncbi:hypothetical protein IFO69_10795 [Echinicola sp. CAU 1574]|uniref:Lipoprotein n=1 Tax=Echinicola arenosa TaxID=2774144 RepID=A0ABR9AKE7_9BACT|nr:hypothetical protein [Echinicola arenosa]MBD8489232.1 hypothetical protein [Echinicola arenosa]
MRTSLLFCFIILLAACQQKETEPIDLGYDYMPLEVNRFWIYEVDETIFYGENDSESSHFYFRDVISESYIGEEGRLVYLVNREKSTDQTTWSNHMVYTLQVKQNALVRSSENQYTVSFVFPPKQAIVWDGNAYNTLNEDDYNLELVKAYEVGGKTYQSTAKVYQETEDDLITIRDNRYEVYAKGVGMIEEYKEVLTYCSRNDCLGEQIIDSGRFIHLKLINNGQY